MENVWTHVSTKFLVQINSGDEEIKKRNFHGVDGISNTVHPRYILNFKLSIQMFTKFSRKNYKDVKFKAACLHKISWANKFCRGRTKIEKYPWGGRYLKHRPPPGTSVLAQAEEWSRRRKLGSWRRRRKRAYTAGTLCPRDGGRAGEALGLAGISRRRDRSRARPRRGWLAVAADRMQPRRREAFWRRETSPDELVRAEGRGCCHVWEREAGARRHSCGVSSFRIRCA